MTMLRFTSPTCTSTDLLAKICIVLYNCLASLEQTLTSIRPTANILSILRIWRNLSSCYVHAICPELIDSKRIDLTLLFHKSYLDSPSWLPTTSLTASFLNTIHHSCLSAWFAVCRFCFDNAPVNNLVHGFMGALKIKFRDNFSNTV